MNYGLYNPIQQHEGTPPYFLELSFLLSKTKINIKMNIIIEKIDINNF